MSVTAAAAKRVHGLLSKKNDPALIGIRVEADHVCHGRSCQASARAALEEERPSPHRHSRRSRSCLSRPQLPSECTGCSRRRTTQPSSAFASKQIMSVTAAAAKRVHGLLSKKNDP